MESLNYLGSMCQQDLQCQDTAAELSVVCTNSISNSLLLEVTSVNLESWGAVHLCAESAKDLIIVKN